MDGKRCIVNLGEIATLVEIRNCFEIYRPDSRQAADNGPQHSSLLLSAVSRKVIAKNPSSHEQCLSRVSSEQGRKCVRMMITIMISKRPDRFPLKNSCKDALNDALSDPCHISSRMIPWLWDFLIFQFSERSFQNLLLKVSYFRNGFLFFFNSPKKQTKNFCPSRLGQKFTFSGSFFGRIEDTKISFRD